MFHEFIHNSIKLLDCRDLRFHRYNKDSKPLESLLKKCPNISSINIPEYISISGHVLDLIGDHCTQLKTFCFDCLNRLDVSERKALIRFGEKCGHKLKTLAIEKSCEMKPLKVFLSVNTFCARLRHNLHSGRSGLRSVGLTVRVRVTHIIDYIMNLI